MSVGVEPEAAAAGGLAVRVAVGGAVVAAAYDALLALSGMGRGRLASARIPEHRV